MLSKVITIAQQKGGTGKTTLAVHLAMAFIKYHDLKVAIIDTDPQGSLGKWFMIRSENKVSNENLTFKTASLWGAQYESKTLKNDHDIVIIDTPPIGLVTDGVILMKSADINLYVVRHNYTKHQALSVVNSLYDNNQIKEEIIINEMWKNYGMTFAEYMHLSFFKDPLNNDLIKVNGRSILDKIVKENNE